jgi:hypothetical protein
MKRIGIIMVLAVFLVSGCMGKEEYIKWADVNAQIAVLNARSQQNPMVNIEWCGQDKQQICKLQVYPQPSIIPYIAQKKDSEWVSTVNKLIGVGGVVGGIYATGSALKGIVNSVGTNAGHNINDSYNTSGSYNTDRHDTNITDSYNTDRHDISDSYNTDRHDINDSYNSTDRHDINNSYNPVDNHANNP